MGHVTQILDGVQRGDANAAEELLPLVYEELRQLANCRMASEGPGQTLQATALVHEAWLRLVKTPGQTWQNRAHFFRTAAECMRRILVDIARRKRQVRHGGGMERVVLDDVEVGTSLNGDRVLLVSEALDRLAQLDATKAEIVKLRFFVGLQNQEIADVLGVSERTVERQWRFAKSWLMAELDQGSGSA